MIWQDLACARAAAILAQRVCL